MRKIRDKRGLTQASEVIMRMKRELEIPHSGHLQQVPGPQEDDGEGPEGLKFL